jgi:predicted esterase
MRNTVSFSSQAVYYQSSKITSETNEIWFVLHGYGQLPQYFIRKFKGISDDNRVIIAPGGLSRFYLDGFAGRVGSTWMTKEERLLDIDNYIKYLNSVAEQVLKEASQEVKITILGFSQGSATACRWAEKLTFPFENLVLHSGAFPTDVDFSGLGSVLRDKKVFMLRGNQDEFINDERRNEQKELIDKLNVNVREIEFEGNHDIHIDSLQGIIRR